MASTDATPLPIKNQAFRLTFPMWLTTGLINSGAAGIDEEISKDGGTMTDCTNSATEIATSSGSYYIDLTATEMDADTVEFQCKSSTTNAITYKCTIYPSSLGKMKVDVETIKTNPVVNAGTITFPNGGTLASTTNITAGTITTATNLTNAPTNGDLTATMKSSINGLSALVAAAADALAAKTRVELALPAHPPGASQGLVRCDTNEATIFSDLIISESLVHAGQNLVTEIANTVGALDTSGFPSGLAHQIDLIYSASNSLINLDTTISSRAPASTALSTAVWTGTIANRIDAAISSRMATFTYTAPDNAGINDAVSGIDSANSALIAMATQISDLQTHGDGAWATITAGAIRTAVGLASANLDTQLLNVSTWATRGLGMIVLDGSVYQYTVNALENAPSGGGGGLTPQQVRDAMQLAATDAGDTQPGSIDAKLDGLGAGSGTGAFTITATVTDDSTTPLQGAFIRLTEGVNDFVATTDVNGEAVFALDAATYTVGVSKAGYQFTPTTRTVTGNEAGTLTNDLEMVARFTPTPPSNPDLCSVYGYVINASAEPVAGLIFTFQVTFVFPSGSGFVSSYADVTATTDEDGFFSVYLRKGTYRVTCETARLNVSLTFGADEYDLSMTL